MRFCLWAIVFCALAESMTAGQQKPCSEQEAAQAEMKTDALKSWDSVYRFYRKFSHCDDGGIAEGVSDAVVKLLAKRWDTVGHLVKHVSNDGKFENFVLRHIDETVDWERDFPKIRQNATSRCPPDAVRLCKALLEKTATKST
jgi:hypothetical protein